MPQDDEIAATGSHVSGVEEPAKPRVYSEEQEEIRRHGGDVNRARATRKLRRHQSVSDRHRGQAVELAAPLRPIEELWLGNGPGLGDGAVTLVRPITTTFLGSAKGSALSQTALMTANIAVTSAITPANVPATETATAGVRNVRFTKLMTTSRRVLLHVWPKRFVRIRSVDFLAS